MNSQAAAGCRCEKPTKQQVRDWLRHRQLNRCPVPEQAQVAQELKNAGSQARHKPDLESCALTRTGFHLTE